MEKAPFDFYSSLNSMCNITLWVLFDKWEQLIKRSVKADPIKNMIKSVRNSMKECKQLVLCTFINCEDKI